jgi:hypothetical protein
MDDLELELALPEAHARHAAAPRAEIDRRVRGLRRASQTMPPRRRCAVAGRAFARDSRQPLAR